MLMLLICLVALNNSIPLLYMDLPVLMWIAVRFHILGAAAALGLLTFVIAYFTATKSGAFSGDPTLLQEKIVELQAFLGVAAFSSLLVSALSLQHRLALSDLRLANDSLEKRVAERTVQLKEREVQLQKSEAHLSAIVTDNVMAIAETDIQGRFVFVNDKCCELTGYSRNELLNGIRLEELIYDADRPETLNLFEQLASTGEPFSIEKRFVRKDGGIVWIIARVSVLKDADGLPKSAVAIIADVTDRKSFERQNLLLMREVNHRSKNLLSLVQAIARQTVAGKHQDFLARFQNRIHSLAASQDLVINSGWKGAELVSLVKSQLGHFSDLFGSRILIEGPALLVSSAAAQTLGMALHELSTNAGKYGALSNTMGTVHIQWQFVGKTLFEISWIERGGPPIKTTRKRGFGSIAIQRLSKISLDADIVFDLAPEGLTWKLKCAAERVLENPAE
jgi:PAS domain S-box-containing protein